MATHPPESNSSPTPDSAGSIGRQVRNLLLVITATLLTVAIFFGVRTQATTVALDDLAENSIPLEIALTNGKPTLMEFYANWCTSCQAMAEDLDALKAQYGDQLNFVMLNVDNSKWLPEMLHYKVDGILYFVFLDAAGSSIASVIGEQPRPIMEENLVALAAGQPLPHVRAMGQTSAVKSTEAINPRPDDPRSHGAQAVN